MAKDVKNTFHYFAYGSNLLKKRIRINNPTAEFVGIGRLDGHQLNFMKYSDHWRGTSATIIPTANLQIHVWGAVWKLHNSDMPALDKQEGVDTNWYFAKTVEVSTPDGEKIQCRTYQQTINPPLREDNEELPLERRPSLTYLDCIVNGAIEYLNLLQFFVGNGVIVLVTGILKKNYRLDFIRYSKFWGGPTASLVSTANAHVWGVIWRLSADHVAILDKQEEVDKKIYYAKHVQVLTPYMDSFKCRTYIQKVNPLPRGDNDEIPAERWPSWTYKEIIILGAMEHQLPGYYKRKLEKLKSNGERGCFKMYSLLMRYSKEKPCVCDVPKEKDKPQVYVLRKPTNEEKN